jgi:uroporphyrinogen decarboxylase
VNERENTLRAIRFEGPDHVPVHFHINPACWHHYDQQALQDLMEEHRLLFPDFRRRAEFVPEYAPEQIRDAPYTDPWGCGWETTDDGITGSVHRHPLADWAGFDRYRAPDPATTDGTHPLDWEVVRAGVRADRESGRLVAGSLPHGHTFLRLQDIRGYENLLLDMMDGDPRLDRLIAMVEEFNLRYVLNWLELQPDLMSYPEDLGMQVGPMLSAELLRRYIKPVYRRLMKPARDRGCIVHMHSDGDIRTLAADLIEGGVEVINLQDLVNGIDWIRDQFAGRTCIELDVDRQLITARGTPAQIDSLIREEVTKLGSRRGGLMLVYGMYPGVPLGNARALMDAMEKYSGNF